MKRYGYPALMAGLVLAAALLWRHWPDPSRATPGLSAVRLHETYCATSIPNVLD